MIAVVDGKIVKGVAAVGPDSASGDNTIIRWDKKRSRYEVFSQSSVALFDSMRSYLKHAKRKNRKEVTT